jgi:probable rRNA maturation factor
MIDLDNQTKLPINLHKLETIHQSLSPKPLELIVMDEKSITNINQEHRGKAESTDVLSFPIETLFIEDTMHQTMPLGTIIICEAFVQKNALAFKHSTEDEFTLLFIHGLLHLLGFDHEVDEGEMRQKEKALILAFDLPKSLIIRTEEY